MNDDTDQPVSRVTVDFHSSSTKDGREAYRISVSEGASQVEADRVLAIALNLRAQAKAAVAAPADDTLTKLNAGMEAAEQRIRSMDAAAFRRGKA